MLREAVSFVCELIEDGEGEPCEFGVSVIDQLEANQQLACLVDVADALLDPDLEPPSLTAWREAMVAVLFDTVSTLVQFELEGWTVRGESTHWRRIIRDACREAGMELDEDFPAEDCDDLEEWQVLLECLADRVLWDEDWAHADDFLDLPPHEAQMRKAQLGIDDDYYTALPHDPADAEMEVLRGRLREIVATATIGFATRPLNGWPQDEASRCVGLHDRRHGLFVGPCSPQQAREWSEARDVETVEVEDPARFDCTFLDWCRRYGTAVRGPEAARRRLDRAIRTVQLEDGTQLTADGDDWLVRGPDQRAWLIDAATAHWAEVGADRAEVARFPTLEAAFEAYMQARETASRVRPRRAND